MKEAMKNVVTGKKPTSVKPEEVIESSDRPLYNKIGNLPKAFEEAMDDDFNTAFAIGLVFDLVRDVNKFLVEIDQKREDAAYIILAAASEAFDNVGRTLGLFTRDPD